MERNRKNEYLAELRKDMKRNKWHDIQRCELWVFSISENQVKDSGSNKISFVCFFSITKTGKLKGGKIHENRFYNIDTYNMIDSKESEVWQ